MEKKNNFKEKTLFIPDGVLFDMDGLMLDTERLELDLYVEISKTMGWPTPYIKLKNTIGMGDTEAEAYYKKEYGSDYPFWEIWSAVTEEETRYGDQNGLPVKKGVLGMLKKLKNLGIPMAVATSTKSPRARWKLERSGLLDYFNVFACGDEIINGKPAPDIFLLAAKKLGKKPENCIGFEDSAAGLAGLSGAGIRSVFVKDIADPAPEILATVWKQYTNLEEAAELFD